MARHRRHLGLVLLAASLLSLSPLPAAAVQARFDLATPNGGPFPSDRFTAADPTHNTGLRVSLPHPDCATRPPDCADIDVINTLDGFNLQPRLSIPFDGPIDVATATSDALFLVSLGDTLGGGDIGNGWASTRSCGTRRPTRCTLFFETDGAVVVDPDGDGHLFEVPIVPPLPEPLSFIP
jgi:hypothetical protein